LESCFDLFLAALRHSAVLELRPRKLVEMSLTVHENDDLFFRDPTSLRTFHRWLLHILTSRFVCLIQDDPRVRMNTPSIQNARAESDMCPPGVTQYRRSKHHHLSWDLS